MSDNNSAEQNPYQLGLTPPPPPPSYPGTPSAPAQNAYLPPQPPAEAAGYPSQPHVYPTYPVASPGSDTAAAAAAHGYAPPPSIAPGYPAQAYGTPPFNQQAMNYGYAPARPSSGLALTSMITGIAAIVLIWFAIGAAAAVAAVVTGHMALNRMKAQPELAGRGMAISGLILGYITLGLAAFFALFFILIFGSLAAWNW